MRFEPLSGAAADAALADLQPDAWLALGPVVDHAWTMADPELLALVLTRSAQLTGTSRLTRVLMPPAGSARHEQARREVSSWPSSALYTPIERSCLAFVEQLQIDTSGVTEAEVEALGEHMDAAAVLGFASAVYVLDAHVRVLAVTAQLLQPEAAH